ncbi:MAG: hypothetical protein AAFX44_01935 [Pseudomonadota bacterium]
MDDEAFTKLYLELQHHDRAELFEAIWPLAISEPVDGTPTTANYLLVKLDLPTDRTCEELLADIRDRYWNLSNKIIPFYLVTKFGKQNVIDCVKKMAGELSDGEQKRKVEGVGYWANHPPENLIEPMHYFEWEEVIEGENYERPTVR